MTKEQQKKLMKLQKKIDTALDNVYDLVDRVHFSLNVVDDLRQDLQMLIYDLEAK